MPNETVTLKKQPTPEDADQDNAPQPKFEGHINYLAPINEPKVFKKGRPGDFLISTSDAGAKIYCKVHGKDSYYIFIGSDQARRIVEKTKDIGFQYVKASDMRELALILTDLADLLENKVKTV